MEADNINILLVDDHELVLKGLRSMLEKEADITVVAEAGNGLEAIAQLQHQQVDLVITDLKMPQMSGLELAQHIRREFPQLKVLILTLFTDKEYVTAILDTEADGYLLKNVGEQELLHAIRHIMNNGTYYAQEIIPILTAGIKQRKRGELVKELSPRELEIVGLICQEYSSNEIAEKLFISKATVDVHRKNILQKTGAKNLVGLIRFAIQNNLVGDF